MLAHHPVANHRQLFEPADLYLKKSAFHDAFAGDLPLQVTDQMQAAQRPFSNEAFQSLSGEPAWKTIPSWYMVATQDHAIPPATERFMAARAHATVVEVSASHVAMISQPEATSRLILEAARSYVDPSTLCCSCRDFLAQRQDGTELG